MDTSLSNEEGIDCKNKDGKLRDPIQGQRTVVLFVCFFKLVPLHELFTQYVLVRSFNIDVVFTVCGWVWGLAGRKKNPSEENSPGLLQVAIAGYIRTETGFISRTFNCFLYFCSKGPRFLLNILNILQCQDKKTTNERGWAAGQTVCLGHKKNKK